MLSEKDKVEFDLGPTGHRERGTVLAINDVTVRVDVNGVSVKRHVIKHNMVKVVESE
jgi:hypothetical protein